MALRTCRVDVANTMMADHEGVAVREESHRGADRSPTSCARNGEKSPALPTSDYSPEVVPDIP